jgi:hypothetical protein
MDDTTPVAMPTPYGQAVYGMAPEPVNLGDLLKQRLQSSNANEELKSEATKECFDWEKYFSGLVPKEKAEVRWYRPESLVDAPTKGTQVGGDHYQKAALQPWDIFLAWGLDPWTSNVLKYCLRYPYKNGKEDLLKARHYLDYLIENYDEVKQKYYNKE